MKMVSTSNFESDRIETNRKLIKPEQVVQEEGKFSAFSLLKFEPTADHQLPEEFDTVGILNVSLDLPEETQLPTIGEMASSPVNGNNLVEGYQLFGSVFTMLQAKLSVDRNDVKTKDYAGLEVGTDDVSTVVASEHKTRFLKVSDASVIIDLAKARLKAAKHLKPEHGGIDIAHSFRQMTEQSMDGGQSRLGPLEFGEEPDTLQATVEKQPVIPDPFPTDGENSGIDFKASLGAQSIETNSRLAAPDIDPSRVSQIVRAVAEQSEAFVEAHSAHSALRAHAGLTGQTLRLSLHPAELGAVEISVSKRGKRLQVSIVPDLEQTGRLLLKDAEQLVKNLGLASSDVDHVQIHITTADGSVEVHDGNENMQLPARSQNGHDSQDGQNATSRRSRVTQPESDSLHEQNNFSRNDTSGSRRGHGAVYI